MTHKDMVTATSTASFPRPKKELEEWIILSARDLAEKKWWQRKIYLIEDIINSAKELNQYYE